LLKTDSVPDLSQGWIADAVEDANKRKAEEKIFPPCNTEWSSAKGLNVWCTNKSGGIDRDWVGVPRRYFKPGKYFMKM
jgi:hypothetical protein